MRFELDRRAVFEESHPIRQEERHPHRDVQEKGFFFAGDHRRNDLLLPAQLQVELLLDHVEQGLLREIVALQPRAQIGRDERDVVRHGLLVGQAQPFQPVDPVFLFQAQPLGQNGGGVLLAHGEHLGGRRHPFFAHLLGEAGQALQAVADFVLGHEGALTLDARDQAVAHQLFDGLLSRVAADVERIHDLALRRHAVAWGELPGFDLSADIVADLQVQGFEARTDYFYHTHHPVIGLTHPVMPLL